MKTWHEIAGCSHNVKNTLAHARHNAHIDRYIRRIRNFHADMRYIRAERTHAERNHIHGPPLHATVIQRKHGFFHFIGITPVIDWTRVFLFPGTDKSSVLDAGNIRGV